MIPICAGQRPWGLKSAAESAVASKAGGGHVCNPSLNNDDVRLSWLSRPACATAGPAHGDRGRCDGASGAVVRASYLETAVIIDGSRDPIASRRFDELMRIVELRIEPVTHDQARIARDAYRDFGKGSGHRAGLNFGDCFAYALAKSAGEALLFKGGDFSHTDITPALSRLSDDVPSGHAGHVQESGLCGPG